jgi:nicotinamidase/pyrazinamidase
MSNNALIIVDVQNDFLPGGALGVPEGDKVIDPILGLVNSQFYHHVLASRDWHPLNHMSFVENGGQWPKHCVAGTNGAEIHPAISQLEDVTLITKGRNPEKEAYSAFDGFVHVEYSPLLPEYLTKKGASRVDVVGLALDYCVAATAVSAAQNRFETHVWLDATRPVEYITGCEAIADMQKLGVTFEFYQFHLTER